MVDFSEPDYSKYSVHDLRDVERRIDRERFPERYARLRAELDARDPDGLGDLPVEDGKSLPPRLARVHETLAGFLIGGSSALAIGRILFSLAYLGPANTIASFEIEREMLAGAIALNLLTAYASYEFTRGARWPRFVLWPVSISLVIQLRELFVVGLYSAWVLYRTRRRLGRADASAD